jgi:Ca2+-binding RTX toxin-like protein
MARSFEVLNLGFSTVEIDTTESDAISNAANLLVGTTFGSAGSPLYDSVESLSPNTFGQIYDTDNNTATDAFTSGGTMYVVDGAAIYLSTLTYADGTTEQVEMTLVQATTGEVFLFPPVFGDEGQQAILEAGPIQSLTLDSLIDNAVEPVTDRIGIDFVGPVEGTGANDDMTLGYEDADGDVAGAGNDPIFGNGGADTIEGGGGSDIIEGGDGNDVIYGDTADGSTYGTLNPTNSDNLGDSGGTETFNTRAVELVTLANGDLIMITSERGTSDAGIASYRVDNDPDSATYGEIIGGKVDDESASVNGDGYRDVEDMAAVTLSNGETYLYTADPLGNSIGITLVNSDGTLANQPPMTDGSGNNQFDDVQELSIAEIDGTHFLLSLGGGSDGGIDDALIVHQVNDDGSLTQADLVVNGTGTGENYLNNGDPTDASVLETFTDSNGNTFVVAGGDENGISLWTLDGTGALNFQNARGDDQAGAGESDPQGNDLGGDLIAPAQTGLFDVDAGTFAEINGEVYLFVGGVDDDVVAFRVDPDTANTDGTFDLTLVGQLDDPVVNISSMTFLPTDSGGSLVLGAETSGLRFYDVTVNPDGTVSLTLSDTISDGAGPEFADSEDIDVEGGILVSAGDDDDGVGIVTTGLNPEAQFAGDDMIDGGIGNDTVYAGGGSDTITLSNGFGSDDIFGGEDADGTDVDVLDASGLTGSGITVTMSSGENGTLTQGANSADFSDFEGIVFTDQGDVFDGNFVSDDLAVNTGAGNDSVIDGAGADELVGGQGDDTLEAGAGSDTLFGGDGNDLLIRGGTDTNDVLNVLNGGDGEDTIRLQDGINVNDQIDGGAGVDTLEVLPGDNRDLLVNMETGNVTDGTIGTQEFINIENVTTGGGNDTIYGDTGNNVLDGAAGDDVVVGGDGADTLIGGSGDDLLVGGGGGGLYPIAGDMQASGGDTLDGGEGNDTLEGNTGDDTLLGGTGNDQLFGEWGADSLSGGDDADTLDGGALGDTLSGGDGNDLLTGGAGDDLFVYTANDGLDTITDFNSGNSGSLNDGNTTNNDFIDLSGHYDHLFELWADQQDDGILNQSNDLDTQGNAVNYLDNTQFDTDGTADNEGVAFTGATGDISFFTFDNTGVICFASGTLIDTPRGPVPVETLTAGDLVRTSDHGVRPLIWASKTTHQWAADAHPDKPIEIKAGALGAGLPVADLQISPQHRVLLPDAEHATGVFAAAKHLVGLKGVRQMTGGRKVTYHHIMLASHEVLFSNGAPTESFFPGRMALRSLSGKDRVDLVASLRKAGGIRGAAAWRISRPVLKSKAAKRRTKTGAALWGASTFAQRVYDPPALAMLG